MKRACLLVVQREEETLRTVDLTYLAGLLLIAPAAPGCCAAVLSVPFVTAASRFASESPPTCAWDRSVIQKEI